LLGPLDRGINKAFTPATTDREVVGLQTTAFIWGDDLVMVSITEVKDSMLLNPTFLAWILASRRERFDRNDAVFNHARHRLEEPFDFGPGFDLPAFSVPFFSEVMDIGFQFQDSSIGWIVVGERLVLTSSPLWSGLAAGPRYILVRPVICNITDERAADFPFLRDVGLLHPSFDVGFD
jgi:hypothetical protein